MPAKSGNVNARKHKTSGNRVMGSWRVDKVTLVSVKDISDQLGLKSQGEVIDRAVKLLEDKLNEG